MGIKIVKFKKYLFNHIKCFISECGQYKVVNYGGKIFLFKKCRYKYDNKWYEQFGQSVEHNPVTGNSTAYKTYREAFKIANIDANKNNTQVQERRATTKERGSK